MKVLAIDSSSVVAGVAILDADRLLYEGYQHHVKNHSVILMPMVEEALHSCRLTPDQMDLFAVSGGPGSFTGLRIGISTVKGLAQAVEKPAAAVPTLDALAYNVTGPENALVCSIMDARRDQVYTCLYRREGDRYIPLMPYSALPVEKLADQLVPSQKTIYFVGDGIPVYRDKLSERLGKFARFVPPYLSYQRASVIGWLGMRDAAEGKAVPYQSLKPFYLRPSQAEQKRYRQQAGGKETGETP